MAEDWVWDGPDTAPGCGVTLALLYYFVSAAEEVDLLDDLDRKSRLLYWEALYTEFISADDGAFDTVDDEAREPEKHDVSEDMPMSIGQILGDAGAPSRRGDHRRPRSRHRGQRIGPRRRDCMSLQVHREGRAIAPRMSRLTAKGNPVLRRGQETTSLPDNSGDHMMENEGLTPVREFDNASAAPVAP